MVCVPQPEFGTVESGVDGQLTFGAGDTPPGIGSENCVNHHGVEDGGLARVKAKERAGEGLALHLRKRMPQHADYLFDFAHPHAQGPDPVRATVDGDAAAGASLFVAPGPLLFEPVVVKRIDKGRASGDDLADGSGSKVLLGLDNFGPVLAVFGNHEDAWSFARGGENAVAGVEGGGHGLFQQYVLAGGEALEGDGFVQVVGQHDIDGVEVALCERFVERGKGLPAGFSGVGLGFGFVEID